MTSLQARAHIHNLNSHWMTWLKRCSALKGLSGQTILEEYAADKSQWQSTQQHMRTSRVDAWPFLRGQLDVAEIADARRRYLDKYVFVAGEHDASAYVEALLVTENAQIQLRLEQHGVTCQGCADRNAEIAKLRAALLAKNLKYADDIDAAAINTMFYRCFMLSDSATCTRTEVRERIEKLMQEEIGTGLVISSSSKAWKHFLSHHLGISSGSAGPLRCQARKYVLPANLEE